MAEPTGTYKLVSSDHFDDFLKAVGMNMVMRKAAQAATPTIHVTVNGDHWKLRQTTAISANEMEFDLGVPRTIKRPDGKTATSVITKDGNRLVEKRTGDGKDVETIREFTGSQLKVTLKVGDVVCVRVFQKQ